MSADFRGKGPLLESDCPFVWYQSICSVSFSFVTIHACDRQTDGQTDRITTPKTALAYARAVKTDYNLYLHKKNATVRSQWKTLIAVRFIERVFDYFDGSGAVSIGFVPA